MYKFVHIILSISLFLIVQGCSKKDNTSTINPEPVKTTASVPSLSPTANKDNVPTAANDNIDYCNASDVKTIQASIHYRLNREYYKFPYKYRYVKGLYSDYGVVVFIPGGPGQGSMNNNAKTPMFDTIYIDPRGVGCNENSNVLRSKDISSENIAGDILEIIKAENIKKYFLYGVSYGTVVATVTAKIAENEGIQKPQAMILEGTIDGAFSSESYIKSLDKESDFFDTYFRGDVLSLWKTYEDKFKETKSVEILSFIQKLLMMGPTAAEKTLQNMIDKARSGEIKIAEKQELSTKATSNNTINSFGVNPIFYKRITCFELRTNPYEDSECDGIKDLNYYEYSRYDVSKYVSDTNVFYFAGDHDPATPIRNAIRHLSIMSQLQGRTNQLSLIKVNLAGHNPLLVDLSDCNAMIWQEIITNNGNDLSSVLKQCSSFAYMRTI